MMSFQEKYEEYKQRKEAQAFFNQNNDQKVYGKDYLIAISKIGFNFSYFTILIGIFEAQAIKKVLNKSGQQLAIIAAVTFVLGIVVAQAIFISITLPFFNVSMLVETFKYCFQNMITGDVLSTIIYLFGAIAAYMALKD